MKLLKGNERGFSLVELVIAIMIMGVLGVGVSAVMVQLLQSPRITHGGAAIIQVQGAGDSVSQDGLQAQSVTFGDDITSENWLLVFTWEGAWTDNAGIYVTRKATVTYTLEPQGSQYRLERHAVVTNTGGASSTTEDTTRTVARYLDPSQMSCEWRTGKSGTFDFTVVSSIGDKSERRTYSISPRPGG